MNLTFPKGYQLNVAPLCFPYKWKCGYVAVLVRNSPHLPENGLILPFLKGALRFLSEEGF